MVEWVLSLDLRSVSVSHRINLVSSSTTTNPDVIKAIHLDYIKAKTDYITANNYAVTQPILERADMSNRLEELTLLSISIALGSNKRIRKKRCFISCITPSIRSKLQS